MTTQMIMDNVQFDEMTSRITGETVITARPGVFCETRISREKASQEDFVFHIKERMRRDVIWHLYEDRRREIMNTVMDIRKNLPCCSSDLLDALNLLTALISGLPPKDFWKITKAHCSKRA